MNVSLPLWALFGLLLFSGLLKLVVFAYFGKRILPKYFRLLDRFAAPPKPDKIPDLSDLPPELARLFGNVNRELEMCRNVHQSEPQWGSGDEEKKFHMCTKPRGHDGDHACECGTTWPQSEEVNH